MDEKQIDALIAQLPRDSDRRRPGTRRILLMLALAAIVLVLIRSLLPSRSTTSDHAPPSRFPLAVCGNGVLEPSEDCELDQPDCPPDCIKRADSSEATTPASEQHRGE